MGGRFSSGIGGRLARNTQQNGKRPDRELTSPHIPFTYPSVASIWPEILHRWFEKGAEIETLAGLSFGIAINRSTPVEFQCLAFMQAIESHHRNHGTDSYMSDVEYEPIKKALIDAIPSGIDPGHKSALTSRIKYGNEYSLRKRLDLTLKGLPPAVATLVTNGDPLFQSRIIATRNYLTHRDDTQRECVLDFKGMFNAAAT